MIMTPIQLLDIVDGNNLFIKREDLYPYSFGGNKARKAEYFFKDINDSGANAVVTYGSSSSNHCRVVANLSAKYNYRCSIVSPIEESETTYNSQMVSLFGAEKVLCHIDQVKATIKNTLNTLKCQGYNPYFIMGGGHGNLGTKAYYDCFKEIEEYELKNNLKFDYIFHASGTGTTQAGLICGQLLSNIERKIIGISIARTKDRGEKVVHESVADFLRQIGKPKIEEDIIKTTIFCDNYVNGGYGKDSSDIRNCIVSVLREYGIPLDKTYTGKAFWGMRDYIKENQIKNKNILFIHTGGTPLFFDYLKEYEEK